MTPMSEGLPSPTDQASHDPAPSAGDPPALDHVSDALSRFAGGAGHDFSNFLTVISGFAQFLRAQYRADPELVDGFGEILQAVARASDMVAQLTVLAGRFTLQTRAVDLNQALQGMAASLPGKVGEQIQVDLRVGSAPLMARLDPARLEEIVSNLCEHIRFDLSEGGTLTLTTERVEPSALARPARAGKGAYARLSFRDTGPGLDPSLVERMFEPFFLKTRLRRGTGLSLALVDALVKHHNGFILVETAQGRGTTFHLHFPSDNGEMAPPPEPAPAG